MLVAIPGGSENMKLVIRAMAALPVSRNMPQVR